MPLYVYMIHHYWDLSTVHQPYIAFLRLSLILNDFYSYHMNWGELFRYSSTPKLIVDTPWDKMAAPSQLVNRHGSLCTIANNMGIFAPLLNYHINADCCAGCLRIWGAITAVDEYFGNSAGTRGWIDRRQRG